MAEKSTIEPAVWRAIWAVLVGAIAVLFDTSIVNVALHTLSIDLQVSVATIQWVSTGYLLALAVAMPVTGWAQRAIGRKRLWLIALVIFFVGSILSSLAWNAGSLIAFRVLQGVGGGVLMPLMGTIVVQAAGGKNLGRIMSIIGIPIVIGPVLGPVLGGLILQNLSWPWLFWVNVPVCIVGFILAVLYLPKEPGARTHFDVVGFLLLAPGLVALLYGFSNAGKSDGFARGDVEIPLIGGALLVAAFTWWALRHKGRALLDVQLLKYWPLASASIVQFFSGVSLFGAILLVPLYFQELRGTSALGAGLVLIAQGAGALVVRAFIGRLSDNVGARWLVVIGFAIVLIGTVPFAFADAQTSWLVLIATLFARGVGLGVVTTPLMTVGFRGLPPADVPDASIISRVSQQIGGSFGGAILTVILAGAMTTAIASGSNHALVASFQQGFWWATGFTTLGLVMSFLLPGTLPADADSARRSGAEASAGAPARPSLPSPPPSRVR